MGSTKHRRSELVIYATFWELDSELDGRGQSFIVFDGVERESLLRSPPDFISAAAQNWEPDTWLLAIDPKEMAQWSAVDLFDNDWLEIRFKFSGEGTANARLYVADANGTHRGVTITGIDKVEEGEVRSKLERIARLDGVTEAADTEIEQVLEDALAGIGERMFLVFDVGQGNWNAVVDTSACPHAAPVIHMFYDCGVATGLNRDSMPNALIDPFPHAKDDAPVILSHWDMDHWAGAALGQPLFGNKGIKIRWHRQALSRKWIVPNQGQSTSGQRISSTAWRLALQLHRRGNLLIWPASLSHVQSSAGDWIVQCKPATGKGNNNNTGLALLVKTPRLGGALAYTLALGDADYSSLGTSCLPLTGPITVLTGLVASHHGGAIKTLPPMAMARWHKLAISHGDKYGHPTTSALDDHRERHWRHQYQTYQRRSGHLADGTHQEIGTVSLGGCKVTSGAVEGECLACPARAEICPVQ